MTPALCLALRQHGSHIWEGCMNASDILAIAMFFFLWVIWTIAAERRQPKVDELFNCLAEKQQPKMSGLVDSPASPLSSSTASSFSNCDDQSSEEQDMLRTVENLMVEFPGAHSAERRRFLKAKRGDVCQASELFLQYLTWVKLHRCIGEELDVDGVLSGNSDLDHWNAACAVALKACNEEQLTTTSAQLPQVIRCFSNVRDYQGHRIFHILPARMDDKLANVRTYALATALYLDRHLNRTSLEQISLCIDVRAGVGWPNIHAVRLIPFMKEATELLLSRFPERLHMCLLYPVPSAFLWIWNILRSCIDREVQDRIHLLPGVNRISAPPPIAEMKLHIPVEVTELLEQSRVASFIQ